MATQKKSIAYAQAKGAPAGFVLPGLIIAAESVARSILTVLASAASNLTLNTESALVRVIPRTNGVYVRFQAGADKTDTKATGVLTLTGAIIPGSHAESVITATSVLDGNTLTIGSTTYRAKTSIAQAYDVAIGGSDAAFLDNLKAAINASGTPGTEYFAGTLAHPTVVATTNTNSTQKVVARVPGTAANSLATTGTAITLVWADTTLGGGSTTSNPGVAPETVVIGSKTYSFLDVLSETNGAAAIANQVLFGADSAAALDNLKLAINAGATAGTNYSTGTVAHTQVSATTNTDTAQTVEALQAGSSYNSVATTDTLTNGSFAAATLQSGDVMAFDGYVPAGQTADFPVEADQTVISFIGDGGTAEVAVIEF